MGRSKVNKYTAFNNSDQLARIRHMLETLELHTMAGSLEKIGEYTEERKGTYYDFIEYLLEKEFVWREQNRIDRWVKNARFPSLKSLNEFDFSLQPSIDEKTIRELASCRYIGKGQNIVLFGPPGVGKTHLSISLGKEAIAKGYEAKFITLDRLTEQITSTDGDSLKRLLRSFTNPPLLIIDDIDYEEPGKNVSSFLQKLIFIRDEHDVSTIYTSNKSFSEWGQLFSGDRVKAAAAIDRICGKGSYIINIIGDSYRSKYIRQA